MKAKQKFVCLLILSLVFSSFFSFAYALTMQEILQGYDNPKGSELVEGKGQVLGATTNGLVGYWNFDEGSGTTASDSSGSGNNGTLVNGPTWTDGKVGSGALSFDGSNDYVSMGNSNNAPPTFTLSAWVKHNIPENNVGIAGKHTGGNGYYLSTFYNGSNGIRKVSLTINSTTISSNGSFPEGTWIHVVGVFDGTNAMLYLNGVFDKSAPSLAPNPTSAGFFVGAQNATRFNGLIDEVRLYNRALSAQEVLDIYNDGSSAPGGSPPPAPPPPPPAPTPTPAPPPSPSPTPQTISSSNSITAASCSQTDVQAAINSASSGDTVTIPAGACTWTTQLTITKGITLQGSGVGSTIIKDGMPISNTGPTSALIRWICQANAVHRLTGIEFQDGGRAAQESNAIIRLECVNTGTTIVRVDHNKFDHLNGVMLRPDTMVGVIDHNSFLSKPSRTPIDVHDSNWNGAGDFGDQSWFDGVTWGSSAFLFVEDNSFTYDAGTNYACSDGQHGARVVFRFNTATRCHFEVHGTESGGRIRGGRALEAYKNNYDYSNLNNVMTSTRSGSSLVWGNSGVNLLSTAGVARLNNERQTAYFAAFGAADGTSVWDTNDQRNPFESHAVNSIPIARQVKVFPSPGWTANQWTKYTIRKTSSCSPSVNGVNCHALISSNTADTITYISASGFGADLSFSAGDTFDINLVIGTIDEIGRGGGSLISGNPPNLPQGWNNQVAFPSYEWLNTNNGLDIDFLTTSTCGSCRENEHFYNHKLSVNFDGSSGVGVGLAANRPVTCKTGVVYWATDEGEWWLANPGPDGRAYKCASTNQWSLYYTPYQYPHPLVSGASVVIAPPPSPSPSPNPQLTPAPSPAPNPTPSPTPPPAGGSSPTPAPSPTPITLNPSPAPEPSPLNQSPVGSGSGQALKLINANGTYYLIIDGVRHGITNPGMLTSYGLTLAMGKPATAADLALPEGDLLSPSDGILAKTSTDKTVWLISNNQRRGFTSQSVFLGLGFKFNQVLIITAPELNRLSVGSNLDNPQSQHPEGVDINLSGTIYWLHSSTLYPYPSLAVYNSWRVPNDFSRVLSANQADKALPKAEHIKQRVVE